MARSLLTVAAVIIILAGMKIAQSIIVPCLLALFLAVLTAPAVRWLVKWKLPIPIAIGIVVALVFAVFYILGTLVATSADDFFNHLPEYESTFDNGLAYLRERLPWLRVDLQSLAPPDSFISFAGRLFSGVGSILVAVALTIFILIFMLYEAQNLPEKARRALGNSVDMTFARRFSDSVQRYLAIKCLVSTVTGVVVWALIKLMGVDYPILWGTFAFLMNFIPNIGSLIAAVPPMFLATVQLGWPGLLISGLGFGAINAVIGNLLEPRLMGRSLDLSTLVVFISLVFWGWLLGPVGALLAVPLTVVVKIGLELYPKSRWLAVLLSQ
ncbi:AI-2E family transporter [Saccharospirillum sp. HFRX-1]|uniref:AI-2E family transporter n=1 Tax=unclassified Saccharospirillum TaxID=2633430 RepID=UPI00370FA657